MHGHSRPDDPIVHHSAMTNGHRAPVPPDGAQGGHDAGPGGPESRATITPPRRFLLCVDDLDDEETPVIETIAGDQLHRVDPGDVRGYGLETEERAMVSMRYPGGHRSTAHCRSAESALMLFNHAQPLRLVFLDPPDGGC